MLKQNQIKKLNFFWGRTIKIKIPFHSRNIDERALAIILLQVSFCISPSWRNATNYM